jgi:threonine synthase
LSADDEVVLCITGNGLKTVDAVADSLRLSEPIAPRLTEVAALIQS